MSDAQVISNLVFNKDGTLSEDQLEGLPDEVRERVTSPEFIAQAKERIRAARGIAKTGRRESKQQPVRMLAFKGVNRHDRRAYRIPKIK